MRVGSHKVRELHKFVFINWLLFIILLIKSIMTLPSSLDEYNNQQKELKKNGKKYGIQLNFKNSQYWPLYILADYNAINEKRRNYVKCGISDQCPSIVQRKEYKNHVTKNCKYDKWNQKSDLYALVLDTENEEWIKEPFATKTRGVNKRQSKKRKHGDISQSQPSIFDVFLFIQ